MQNIRKSFPRCFSYISKIPRYPAHERASFCTYCDSAPKSNFDMQLNLISGTSTGPKKTVPLNIRAIRDFALVENKL